MNGELCGHIVGFVLFDDSTRWHFETPLSDATVDDDTDIDVLAPFVGPGVESDVDLDLSFRACLDRWIDSCTRDRILAVPHLEEYGVSPASCLDAHPEQI